VERHAAPGIGAASWRITLTALAAVAVGITLLTIRSHDGQRYAGDEPH
jgi:hypothetical protein